VDLFEIYCAERGLLHNDYRQRIAASKFHNALGAMMYYARINNHDAYEKVVRIADGI
jgi:hypothetical protein